MLNAVSIPTVSKSLHPMPMGITASWCEDLGFTTSSKKLADIRACALLNVLNECKGNRTHCADILGIGIRTLQRTLKSYSMENYGLDPFQQRKARAVRLARKNVIEDVRNGIGEMGELEA